MAEPYKVMLIDDDYSVHTLIKRILEDAGYSYCGAYGGEEGLEMLSTEHPDLLLLDVMMPGMNGFDVCKSIRRKGTPNPRRVPFRKRRHRRQVDWLQSRRRRLRGEAVLFRRIAVAHRSRICVATKLIWRTRRQRSARDRAKRVTLRFSLIAMRCICAARKSTSPQRNSRFWRCSRRTPVRRSHAVKSTSTFGGRDSNVDESSITVFMRKIREKIEDNPSQPKYLLTVWRVGYKFAERV